MHGRLRVVKHQKLFRRKFYKALNFTSAYFGSLFATLYFAMALQSTILTTLAATIQVNLYSDKGHRFFDVQPHFSGTFFSVLQ
jgi:hypothetical protein